ncbi:uncharacterized protein NDAI_0B00810 [Naumovozyma dairenensis CBS 421]|uniref:PhoD-like phosphatase domain-containing protein n=1 Tax=Naumovozyma dairenensis (strain ATCC 10597 / BCRC 20456 / CBS 421 / NBRC 0211 / NRRL Y-12639) TaxID=1071378 RepID=G0W5Q4_NAUDC|nr:hypothetical protein NDAI_0B00810 [Naumovozyma dairenensis CBS 421]CCD23115.1 hypothetical protein NDAI_0B00810 [Naumovozyma dairenensis CBS 421]
MTYTENEWFDDWDTEALYQEKVRDCDQCIAHSPINNVESGVVCGPNVRLIDVNYDTFMYNGSILIVTKNLTANEENVPIVTYTIGPATNSDNTFELKEGEFPHRLFHTDKLDDNNAFQFYRYKIELPLQNYEQMVKYTINNESKPHYRFFIPSKTMNFNTIAYSCNGFSLAVDTSVFKGSLWFDILNKHSKFRYHVMLGGGDQIYSDSINLYCPAVKKWLKTHDPIKRYSTKMTPEFFEQLNQFYLKEYIEWYGFGHWKGSTPKSMTTQNCFPIATSTIPSINIWDDHDIIDGFGSYSDAFMKTPVFSSIGKAAYKYYMLFQHHVSIDANDDDDIAYLKTSNWILGKRPGQYIEEKSHSVFTRLGPTMGMLGLDCRTERKLKEIVSEGTYQLVFERLHKEIQKGQLDHLLIMLGVPIAYPRLVWLEWLFSSRLLAPLKYLSKKGLFARGLVNDFNGDVELLDDLNDHWCARHHKAERNLLITRLQDFGAKYGIRITILSGDVHLASLGRFKSKIHKRHLANDKKMQQNEKTFNEPENDVRLMFNVISSAVVNTPPPDPMAKLLQARVSEHHFDFQTTEDSVPLFKFDTDGITSREQPGFLNKRNWSDIIPMENVFNNKYLNDNFKVKLNDRIIPGILKPGEGIPSIPINKEQDQAYPVTKDGIMVSIHVETDRANPNSFSTCYSLPIPELRKKEENLSHKGAKHLPLT